MERLQKIIAQSGVYSRRKAEELIAQGKVIVDGKKITTLGTKVTGHERIVVSGKPIHVGRQHEYVVFYKPRKCMVTRDDPEGRTTIYDLLPKVLAHLKPVGRLDYDTEGLLLLTNDGEIAARLTHPRFHIEKIYEVKVTPKPNERQLDRLRLGIMLDGRKTLPAKIEVFDDNPKSTWIRITLKEGRNRQIRRMCEDIGLTVKTLIRTHFGPLDLKAISVGKWKSLASFPSIKIQ